VKGLKPIQRDARTEARKAAYQAALARSKAKTESAAPVPEEFETNVTQLFA
jgi:hypothetical protein